VVPVTLLICHELDLSPYPFLFAEIFASNIGGTATLIGAPPNIMIGSAVHLNFNDFVINLAPVVPLILLVTLVIIYAVWGRKLQATDSARQRIMQFRERDAITDATLLKSHWSCFSWLSAGLSWPIHYVWSRQLLPCSVQHCCYCCQT
jgi:Na+/H+ antiporter NhaD/arsenite permease-like protein